MTEKYAWYQVPGIWEYSKERKVRLSCFRLYLDSYLVPGTRYETISIFVCFLCLLPTCEAVPLHTSTYPLYSYRYSTHIVWYRVVRACNASGACEDYSAYHRQAPRAQNFLCRWQRRRDVQKRGVHRHPQGVSPCSFGDVRGTKLNAQADPQTR